MMPMKNDRCIDCTFVQNASDGSLQCRRFPPRGFPMAIPSSVIAAKQPKQLGSVTIWPTVHPEAWCGEYRMRDLDEKNRSAAQ